MNGTAHRIAAGCSRFRTMMGVLACVFLISVGGHAADPPATTPQPPTSEETAILAWLNADRASWSACDAAILESIRTHVIPTPEFQWANYAALSGQTPPVVFNAGLMEVAHHLLAKHFHPTDGKRYDLGAELTQAGYAPTQPNLVMGATGASSLSIALQLALTNSIGDRPAAPGTTIPIFAREEALGAGFKEVGIAVASHAGATDLVIVLGTGSAKRYLGGIVYADANHDRRYAPGEGRAGVKIMCGQQQTTTGPSGVWWLALTDTAAAQLIFTADALTCTVAVEAGTDNSAINWRMPLASDLALADKAIASTQSSLAHANPESQRALLVRLLTETRPLILDGHRKSTIAALVTPVSDDFLDTLHRLESSLSDDPKPVFDTQAHRWPHAMSKWFASAQIWQQLHEQVQTYLALPPEKQPAMIKGVCDALIDGLNHSSDPVFTNDYLDWLGRVDLAKMLARGPIVSDPSLSDPSK